MAPREDAFEKLRCEETDQMKKEAWLLVQLVKNAVVWIFTVAYMISY